MKKLINLIYLLIPVLFSLVKAQTITKIDTLSGTELKISANKNIDDLIEKLESKCRRDISNTNNWNTENSNNESDRKPENKISVPNRKLTNAEICQRNPRIMGYKIQLTVVKSNKEANEVKAYFRRRFPSIKVETDASLRPNYKILAGSYFSKSSASGDLKKIREFFKSASAVQYYIFCEEGK